MPWNLTSEVAHLWPTILRCSAFRRRRGPPCRAISSKALQIAEETWELACRKNTCAPLKTGIIVMDKLNVCTLYTKYDLHYYSLLPGCRRRRRASRCTAPGLVVVSSSLCAVPAAAAARPSTHAPQFAPRRPARPRRPAPPRGDARTPSWGQSDGWWALAPSAVI